MIIFTPFVQVDLSRSVYYWRISSHQIMSYGAYGSLDIVDQHVLVSSSHAQLKCNMVLCNRRSYDEIVKVNPANTGGVDHQRFTKRLELKDSNPVNQYHYRRRLDLILTEGKPAVEDASYPRSQRQQRGMV